MSVRMIQDEYDRPLAENGRTVSEIASSYQVDPRLPGLVPGFDAPFFQAGLAGYSDGAMRLVARAHDCPYCITEALLDLTLINGGKGRRKEDPDLIASECGMGDLTENRIFGLDDHPIAGQIMGTRPETMAQGARILVEMGYDMIDVNLACPVKKIRKQHRGGHFLAYPDEAVAVLEAVRDAVPDSIPCSLKMRRAFDDTEDQARNFERVFDAAYDIGFAWATVHCRTVEQKYHGPGRWSFLQDLVRKNPDRIIFGSGDIWCVEDIFLMLETCGVHAVSVARGCIGNPWIFRQARQMMSGLEVSPPTLLEQTEVLKRHHELSVVIHGEKAASRMMRKFGIKFSVHHPDPETVRQDFIRCSSTRDWLSVLVRHYDPSIASILCE
jgi:tRNA-dihydrouridine synthase B